MGTYAVGISPQSVAFDGTNVWVANVNSNNVTKLVASTGITVGTYPTGLTFDGMNVWVTNDGSNTVTRF